MILLYEVGVGSFFLDLSNPNEFKKVSNFLKVNSYII